MKEKRTTLTPSIDCYQNPFIPKGFTYVTGEWNTGFVISDEFGNEFAWVPVGCLENNGTLDGISFNSKFGLRNWYNYDFSQNGWHETVPKNILESINKWGGFYFACYTASVEKGNVVFKKGNLPLIEMTYNEAVEYEASFRTNAEDVNHCLMLGSAYDSLFQWIIQSGTKTKNEILDDSTDLGNYANNEKYHSKVEAVELLPTGHNKDWCINNIYDLAGNVVEFTQEQHSTNRIVLRSGNYRVVGRYYPIADRYFREPPTRKVNLASFRSMLFHK